MVMLVVQVTHHPLVQLKVLMEVMEMELNQVLTKELVEVVEVLLKQELTLLHQVQEEVVMDLIV
jgi:hypothetical protein